MPASTEHCDATVLASAVGVTASIGTADVSTIDFFRTSVPNAWMPFAHVRRPTGVDDKSTRRYHAGLPWLVVAQVVAVDAIAAPASIPAPTMGMGTTVVVSSIAATAEVPALEEVTVTDPYRASIATAYLPGRTVRYPLGATDTKTTREYTANHPYLALGNSVVHASSIAPTVVVPTPTMSVGVTVSVASIGVVVDVPTVAVPTVGDIGTGVVVTVPDVVVSTSALVVLDALGVLVVFDSSTPFRPTVSVDAIGVRCSVGPHPRPQAMRREWGRLRIATDAALPDVVKAGSDGR